MTTNVYKKKVDKFLVEICQPILPFVDKKDADPKPLRHKGFLAFRASFSELLAAFLNCTINGESCKEKFKTAGYSELLKAKRGRQELAALHS